MIENNYIYYESAKSYPNDYRGVKWASAEAQFLRFKILCEIAEDVFKSSLLDVGCGLGHLVDYLIDNQFTGQYKGIDIVYEMILGAKKRHPEFDFEANDIDSIEVESYDYVLASGIFAFVEQKDMQEMIQKLFSRAKKGLAFNCLSTLEKRKENGLVYHDQSKILEFCKLITPHLVLRHDYLANDFTVYLYK